MGPQVLAVFAFPRSVEQGLLLLRPDPSCLVDEVRAQVASWLQLPAHQLILCLEAGKPLNGDATLRDAVPPGPARVLLFAIPVLDEVPGAAQRLLGDGASGEVHSTTVLLPCRSEVAVKVVAKAAHGLPPDLLQFLAVLAEGYRRKLADLRPPSSLLAPLGLVRSKDGRLHMATRKLAGDLCSAVIEAGKARAAARAGGPVLSPGAILAVLASQLDATLWLSRCGFAHSDHKLENVLFTAAGDAAPAQPAWARQTQAHQRVLPEGMRAVVCDLGGLRRCEPTSSAMGTWMYRAPEQGPRTEEEEKRGVRGPIFDPLHADLWSIACSLVGCTWGSLVGRLTAAQLAGTAPTPAEIYPPALAHVLPPEACMLCQQLLSDLFQMVPERRVAGLRGMGPLQVPEFLPPPLSLLP